MASKLSKLQCFSTCLSVLSWVARREAVSLVKRPFFLSLSPCLSLSLSLTLSLFLCTAAIIIIGLSDAKLCPFISDCASPSLSCKNYPFILLCHKITAWWRLAVFSVKGGAGRGGGWGRGGCKSMFLFHARARACVSGCVWASSECQNVVTWSMCHC